MAANSALLIVCLSGCDLISMWVGVCVCGLTTDVLNVGFLVYSDLFVCMKMYGLHAARNGPSGTLRGWGVGLCMFG